MLNNNLVKKFLPEKTRNSTRSKNRFLFIFSCLAFIFCSTICIQSNEYVINDPVILNGETLPDLKNIDRSAIIDNGDTVVFDFSQAVLSNGFLDLPVSIISDDIDVFSLDFQFRFNTTDFTYNTVINSYGLEALQGNFNVADQILRVFSFDLNVLPNNTEMMKVRFSTMSTNSCSLDLFNIIPLLNGEQCSYKIIGCGNLPANAGVDQTICDDFTQLAANQIVSGIPSWSVISGSGVFSNVNDSTTLVSGLSPGENIFRWTFPATSNTPETFDEVSIFRDLPPSIANAGLDYQVCGNNTNLPGEIPLIGSGVWTLLSGNGTLDDSTDANSLFTFNNPGTYTLIWEVTNGSCPEESIDTLTIQKIDVANAGTDTLFCGNEIALNATASASFSGFWTVNSGSAILSDSASPNTLATNLSQGINLFTWTLSGTGCPDSTSQVQVTVLEQPSVSSAGGDQIVCGNSAVLAAISPAVGNGLWTATNSAITIQDPSNPISGVSNLTFGVDTLIWTVTNGICLSVDSAIITSIILPVANAGEDQTNCGNSTTLSANTPTDGTGIWSSLNASIVFAEPSNPLSAISNLTFGVDTLIWIVTSGTCISVDSVFITSNVLPQVNVGLDTTICEFQQSITIPISASGYTSLSWEVLLGNGEVNDQTTLFPSFNNMSLDQNNSFGIIVQNGLCVVYDTLDIFVNSDESQFCNTRPIFIPEGFSPNGDGTYDLFQILNLNGLNANLKIFNRWGDEVFTDANYQNDWNGTANQGLVLYGEELPAGTYFYIIQIEGEAEPRKDYLTLWR